jgi:hypothetical protein
MKEQRISSRKILAAILLTIGMILTITACNTSTPAPDPTATPVPPNPTPEPENEEETAPPTEEVTAPPSAEVDWDDRAIFRDGLVSGEQAALDELAGATVYRIELTIPDDFLTLQGHQAVRYTNQEDGPLEEVYFQLFPSVAGGEARVSNVTIDGEPVEAEVVFQQSALHVPLPAALHPGESIVIDMAFEVDVAHEMGGNYGLFGYFDDVLVLDEFYPVIPVYDDEGWNVKDPLPVGDVTYFDASFYVVQITGPAELIFVTSGIEVAREESGDQQTATFAAGPARTFYVAASEYFTVVSEEIGETTVNSYAFPDYMEGAEMAMEIAVDALESFSARYGAYPYTEFDVASTPMLALGIEYPGMTGITLAAFDPDATVAGWPSQVILESATAHEVAHQWFYNAVGSDQVDEPWMDEAFAQYLTAVYYTDTYGPGSEQGYIDSWYGRWDRVDRDEIPIGLSCADYEDSNYSAIIYGRGPLFLEALASEIGQNTFDALMSDYYQSYKWSIGTGEDFRALAEEHCNCDLTEIWEEWVYATD